MNLNEQREQELAAAKQIIEGAKSAARSMSDDERGTVQKHVANVEKIDGQLKSAAEDERLRGAIGAALKGADGDDKRGVQSKGARSIGEAFVKSDAYRNAVAAVKSGSRFTTAAVDTGLDLKALTTTGPRIGGVQEGALLLSAINRPVVGDLFAQGQLSGSVLSYLRETTATNGAAAVAEGGVKPASDLALDRVEHGLSKIATVLDVPDEFLEDADAARSYIDGRLTLFIQMEEEDQLLHGSGAAPNMRGLLNTVGIQTVAAADAADNFAALYRAITACRTVALLEPDACVINPVDYQRARLETDANGQFYSGGPFTGQYGQGGVVNDPAIWGLRTVVSPAVAAGTAIVGAFAAGAQVFRKGGITVDATNSDGDKFRSNITTIRAEERAGLAVYRPAAFVKVTLAA